MAKITYRAVVMSHTGTGGDTYEFELESDLRVVPADELVEALMRHIDRSRVLGDPIRYELNAANRFPDKDLVAALGSLLLADGAKIPFIAMIGPAV